MQRLRISALDRLHVYGDFERMGAAAEDQTAHWANIAVVPAPCQCNVAVGGRDVVRRIYIEPTSSPAVRRHPGVRTIRAYELLLYLAGNRCEGTS